MPPSYHAESPLDSSTITEHIVPTSPYHESILSMDSSYYMSWGTTTSPTHSSPTHFTPSVQDLGYSPQGQSTYSKEYAGGEKSPGFPSSEWQPGRSISSLSFLDAPSPRAFISDEPIDKSTQSYDSTLRDHYSLVRLLTEVLQNLDSKSAEAANSSTNDDSRIENVDRIITSTVRIPNLETTFEQSELFMSILSRYCRVIHQLDSSAIFDLAKDGIEQRQPVNQRLQLSDSAVEATYQLSRDHPAFLLTIACYVRILDIFDHFMAQPSLSSPMTNDRIPSNSNLPNLSLGGFRLPSALRQNLVVETIAHFVERLDLSVSCIISRESMGRPELQNEEPYHADDDIIHELTIKIINNRKRKILERVKHYHEASRTRVTAPDA